MPTIESIVRQINKDLVPQFEERCASAWPRRTATG